MTYYRAFIIAGAMIIMLLLAAALDKKMGKFSWRGPVIVVLAAAGIFFSNKSTRIQNDMVYYQEISRLSLTAAVYVHNLARMRSRCYLCPVLVRHAFCRKAPPDVPGRKDLQDISLPEEVALLDREDPA